MAKLDLIDLRLLKAINVTGSVSKAADTIGLSQPSVSTRLGRLRQHFNDELFVRTSTGMRPTNRASALMPPLDAALRLFDGTLGEEAAFHPVTSDRTFTMSMTNIGQLTVLPSLLERLALEAPQLNVKVTELDARTAQSLEEGTCDLAIGVEFQAKAGFYQQTLFDEHYVLMARRDHPRLNKRLTLRRLAEEAHVAVDAEGTSRPFLDRALRNIGIERHIRLRVPSFLGLAQIVTHSDLLALVPEHLAQILARSHQIQLHRLPVDLPSYTVKQYWHSLQHRDPANSWFRAFVAELLREPER